MGLGDLVPDSVEDWAEDRVEDVGEGIDAASDWGADRLDDVGWHSGADWVREKGDSAANALGAAVDEMQLGETEDETKLVHGSPEKLRSTASHLTDFKTAFTNVGNGLKGLDSSHLKGEAADAFREKVAIEPKKWFKAADACEKAAKALKDFAGTVDWAQKQAQEAITLYNKGKKASEAHEGKVDSYNKAVDSYNAKPADERDPKSLPDKPGADPGAADIKAAQEKLAEARRQRNDAAGPARSAVAGARDAAPEKPSYGEQALDGLEGLNLSASHFYGGIVKGTAGIVSFARSVNPTDPYNITHPAEFMTSLNSTTAGLVRMANDPLGAAKTMYDGFMKDPAEGTGRLIPELLGTRGLGSIKKIATVAKHLPDEKPPKTPGRGDVDNNPDNAGRGPGRRPCDGDPVDVATGRVLLPQTDVSLPGALPLVFKRGFESSYRAGRWFGPSWSSTIDQRLEIDAEGVVFHGEDNLLLAYPHPAPDVPTLPETGARWPLDRTVEGDYVLTDEGTGRAWQIVGPQGANPGGSGTALLDAVVDRNGNRISFEYDSCGTPTSIVHEGGYHLKVTADNGRVTALCLAEAAPDGGDQTLVRFGYADGNLTSVTNSSGVPLQFDYDGRGRIKSWTDTNDRRFSYEYDEEDRCIAQSGENGCMQFTFDYNGLDERTGHRVTTVTDPERGTRRNVINERLQVVAEIDALGNTVFMERDRCHRLLSRTDAAGSTTHYQYGEASDQLTSVIRPDGMRISAVNNEFGLPVEIINTDGGIWRQEYDERGNRTRVTDPAGHVTRYTYDSHGFLTSYVNALGATTRVRCNSAGLPVEIQDPLGAVTTYERDAFGRPIVITDSLGAETRLQWTIEGKLSRRTGPDGAAESWTFDGEGNCTSFVDANGGITAYQFGDFDRLVARTGPNGVHHEFSYDQALRLTKVTNPQQMTWSYEYDSAGRIVSETDFDGRRLRYGHDAVGRLISRTNPAGMTVTFERDSLGQIVSKSADGQRTTYDYDAAGNLIHAIGPDAELLVQRDKLGRVKTELLNGRVLTYTYDAVGNRTRRVTPSGAASSFTYDDAGNRATLMASGHTLEFTRDAVGREIHRRVDGAVDLEYTWDPAGRLTAQTVRSPSATRVQQRTYTYRPDGHLLAVDDHLNGSQEYDLDPVGRVTTVLANDWDESYAYDESGNQTRAHWPAEKARADTRGERTYGGTQLLSAGAVRYEHDAAGRVILRQKNRLSRKPDTWRYTWDSEDHLTSVTTPDGCVWRYLYDPLGRRIAKQRLDGDRATVVEQVDFTWDGPTLIEQTTTSSDLPDPVTLTWNHDGLRPLTQTERITDTETQGEIDSRFFAIVTDLIGTPTELVDECGEIAWHGRATLWGTTTWNINATAYTPLRFPGQYYDPETELHYNLHRHYDPTTARYATQDPLGLAPTPNPSAYVHNPKTWTDPYGLTPCKWDMSAVDEKYDKHVEGIGKRPGEAPDMPEYAQTVDGVDGFDRYMKDAEDLMNGPPGENVREVVRASDGAVLRLDPEGRLAIQRDGKIVNFFRPDNPREYMENESVR